MQSESFTSDDAIVQQAKDRFKLAEAWEADARANWVYDMRFANGDSSNLYQWSETTVTARQGDNKPCLTVNRVIQHCLHVINEGKTNPSQIEIRGVGNGASAQAAKVMEGLVRHIEYISNAQAAYNNASYAQVISGLGYWRVVTDYASATTFDQEIFIRRIADPLSVYLDPDISEADGSDARYAIIFNDMPRDQFKIEHPKFADDLIGSSSPLGFGTGDSWDTKEHVRVAEYFRKSMVTDTLHLLDNGTTVLQSEAHDHNLKAELEAHTVRERTIETPEIEWFLIGAGKIIDRKKWAGKYIPIIPVVGMQTVIDKKLDRRGMTRGLIDPQRIYNHFSSAMVEQVALQPKSPFLASVAAISGLEEYWAGANIDNKPYLPYNSFDEQGNAVPKPERSAPPVMSQAFLEGMKVAAQDLQWASGQFEAEMGVKTNDVSGKAIDARQRQGAVATYHFVDRFSQAIRFTGRILIDLIPRIYDTARITEILAEDGSQSQVQIDPNAQQAHQQTQNPDDPEFDPTAIQAIFNPNLGDYDVIASIGPSYETRRQETFHAVSEILQNNKELVPIVGDILMQVADFPMADQLAKRLKNMVPPKALGVKVPDPEIMQLQQQLAQQHQVMSGMGDELKKAKDRAADYEQKLSIQRYDAETERMKAVGMIDPAAMRPIIRQLVSEALGTPINPIMAAHAWEDSQMAQPLPPGASPPQPSMPPPGPPGAPPAQQMPPPQMPPPQMPPPMPPPQGAPQ